MALLDLQGMELANHGHGGGGGGGTPPPSLFSIQFCDFRSDLSVTLCS